MNRQPAERFGGDGLIFTKPEGFRNCEGVDFQSMPTGSATLQRIYFPCQSMDLQAEILKEHSKRQTVRIAKWIGPDKRRFRQLMELLLHGDRLVTQRAAWILSSCYEFHPQLITPWLPALLKKMQERDVHDALKRNVVRGLACIDIPKPLLGTVVSLCFEYLNSVDAPIAVKVHAMTVLQRVTKQVPDLKHELQTSIELMIPYVGPALRARGKIVIKQLVRDQNTGKLRT
ncbi:MAG: hypothetical protein NTZ35_20190 [Ignavibacteriales bacterium]|nr:hypothetical protein [Ignavibacteriales bacterium]